MKSGVEGAGFMKRFTVAALFLAIILICTSCWGPQKSIEEEKVLSALSNIQINLETNVSYEQYLELLGPAKIEIDILKSSGKNNRCFMGAVDKCYAFYFTGGKAWKQKLAAERHGNKNWKQPMRPAKAIWT
jgi:hypothetical protein